MSRKRVPLNQNECTANFRIGVPFEQNLQSKISSHVLAIYLINDHPIVREYVWEKILCCNNFYNSNFMIIHWIFCVIMFTVIGIGFDCLISKINKLVRLKG